MERQAEHEHIKSVIADLEAQGVTLYKLALMLNQPYNTVKHWKLTGRVESHDAKILEGIHRRYCPAFGYLCQIEPQHCEVSHIGT